MLYEPEHMKNFLNQYIFVSYSHKNKDLALPFIKELEKRYNVWYDKGLTIGAAYDDEISEKIANCSLFIFLVTRNSISSEYCLNEIRFATDTKKKPFIIVYLEEIQIPDSFDFKYGKYQYIDCYRYRSYIDAILNMESKSDVLKKIKIWHDEKIKNDDISEIISPIQLLPRDHYSSNEFAAINATETINRILSEKGIKARITDYFIGSCETRLNIQSNNPNDLLSINENIIKLIESKLICKVFFDYTPVGNMYPAFVLTNTIIFDYDFLQSIYSLDQFRQNDGLALYLGEDEREIKHIESFKNFENILIGGDLSSGSTDFFKSIVLTLIKRNKSDQLKIVLMNTNKSSIEPFKKVRHLLYPLISDPQKASLYLGKILDEIEHRELTLKKYDCVSIIEYRNKLNELGAKQICDIVVFIDNFEKFVFKNPENYSLVNNIISKCANVGIHLVLSTDKFYSDIFQENIKQNCKLKIVLKGIENFPDTTVFGLEPICKPLRTNEMIYKYGVSLFRVIICKLNDADTINVVKAARKKIFRK